VQLENCIPSKRQRDLSSNQCELWPATYQSINHQQLLPNDQITSPRILLYQYARDITRETTQDMALGN
jgi:hypothetical protein